MELRASRALGSPCCFSSSCVAVTRRKFPRRRAPPRLLLDRRWQPPLSGHGWRDGDRDRRRRSSGVSRKHQRRSGSRCGAERQPAFSSVNETGIHGRRVRLVLADDAYDAEKAAGAVLSLIEKDHVFTLFGGVGTPTMVRALPVVRKAFEDTGLFYFANFTGAQPQRQPPNFKAVFNVRASYYQETHDMVEAFVRFGRKTVGVFAQDDAYGVDGRTGVEKALSAHGLQIAAEARYPRGQTYDVSTKPQLDILRGANADAIIMIGSYQACAAFIRDRPAGGMGRAHSQHVSFVGADPMLELLRDEEKKSGKRIGLLQLAQYTGRTQLRRASM